MDYRARITLDPAVRSGKPCIRGTRIAVADIFDYLGGGMTIAEVLDDFPDLSADDIQASFAYAADRDRKLSIVPGAASRDYDFHVREKIKAGLEDIRIGKMHSHKAILKEFSAA